MPATKSLLANSQPRARAPYQTQAPLPFNLNCPTSSRSASSWATAIWVVGALLRPEVIEAFGKRIRSFNTFGGNPVSCAMAHAVLKVIKAGQRLVLISAKRDMKGRS